MCVVLLSLATAIAQEKESMEGVRANLEQWVETRQLTSRLQSDWRSDKEMLDQTAAVHERELSGLNEALAKADTGTSQVRKEHEALETQKAELEEAKAAVAAWATQCEQRMRILARGLPAPLTRKLEPLLSRLPQNPSETRLNPVERMQNLVGILNEVDKFNSSVVVESELKKRPSGEEIQVKTLYAGLGQAWFVDKSGSFAGVGRPTATGWAWEDQANLGARVLRAISIAENVEPPAFEQLPMSTQ